MKMGTAPKKQAHNHLMYYTYYNRNFIKLSQKKSFNFFNV